MIQDPVEIRHLRYFLAVAEAGSFSRAADRLAISQPSVSQQMRDLEANLRVSLFQRRGKRILLTSAGLIFQEHARAILERVENFLEEVSSDSAQLRGSLHIGTVPYLDMALVPPLLGLFAAKYPSVHVTVAEISSDDIETALEEGRLDVGLGFLTHHSPNLSYELLCSDEFALIVPTGHPWWKRRIVPFSELHQQRFLQLPRSFSVRRMADEICQNHRVRPRTVAEISAIEALLRSLAPLNAASLLPKVALRGARGLKPIRLRGKNLRLEIGLLRLKDSSSNSLVAAFTEIAKTIVPKMVKKWPHDQGR
ncbi:MAG TPA: LysR substrate-binding domain-containing protein [Candidatus Udaeobacter sp.]|jgi:LysR family cyn operon transcriptional activator|nr:LysR substrate-binding domain-containing protein [Candidatus Udaeobacter sp.]